MRCVVNDDECTNTRLRNGMCELHYRRLQRTGTIEPRKLVNDLERYIVVKRTFRLTKMKHCWLWRGNFYPNGYGQTARKTHGTKLAHRMMYIEHIGPISEGLELDHLCRHRWCVNPWHLEPVTREVNMQRGHAARQLCKNGLHPNTGGICYECKLAKDRRSGARYRQRLQSSSS